jgi:hypothetical protein
MTIAHLYGLSGTCLLGTITVPGGWLCGIDRCHDCTDCLHCQAGDECPAGDHRRVVHGFQLEQFLADHSGAAVLLRAGAAQ